MAARSIAPGMTRSSARPYRSFLFDALAGVDAWRFALAVPPDLGLICGIVDASTADRDETEVMVWAMA